MRQGDETISLREMIAQLIDAAKAYARAEIAYLKQLATARAGAAAVGIGLAIGALLIVQASIAILLAALGFALARWIGLAAGFALSAILGLIIAGALAWIGARRIAAAGSAS